jgi:hypothetical protein
MLLRVRVLPAAAPGADKQRDADEHEDRSQDRVSGVARHERSLGHPDTLEDPERADQDANDPGYPSSQHVSSILWLVCVRTSLHQRLPLARV